MQNGIGPVLKIKQTPTSFKRFDYQDVRYVYLGHALPPGEKTWIQIAIKCSDGSLVSFDSTHEAVWLD